jgi:hypothetical protein
MDRKKPGLEGQGKQERLIFLQLLGQPPPEYKLFIPRLNLNAVSQGK